MAREIAGIKWIKIPLGNHWNTISLSTWEFEKNTKPLEKIARRYARKMWAQFFTVSVMWIKLKIIKFLSRWDELKIKHNLENVILVIYFYSRIQINLQFGMKFKALCYFYSRVRVPDTSQPHLYGDFAWKSYQSWLCFEQRIFHSVNTLSWYIIICVVVWWTLLAHYFYKRKYKY